MENIENFVLNEESTENVDTVSTEEITGEATEEQVQESEQSARGSTEKTFTQSELDEIVEKRLARERAKIHKKYEKQVELAEVIRAGTGKDITETTEGMRKHFESKGIIIPTKPAYSDNETKILAEAEAKVIIDAGYDEVMAELKDLTDIGFDNMDARQKVKFQLLATHQKQEERVKELASIGVPEIVYSSKEFKDFATQFNANTPMKTVYELYTRGAEKPPNEKIGSMKNNNPQADKDIFTPEEVDKLTDKDYENPKIMEKVRRSMLHWGR